MSGARRTGLPALAAAAALGLAACPASKPAPTTPPPPSAAARELPVTSRPPGGRVAVDGVEVCTTPCTARVEPGVHRVAVRMTGYLPWHADVEVGAAGPAAARVDAELVASH